MADPTSSMAAPTLSAADMDVAKRIIGTHASLEGACLPMLHALQEQFGFVPQECDPLLADALNVSRAEVHGVVSFYHDFRRTPAGRHTLKLCRAEACQATGGAALAERLMGSLGVDWGGTSRDGSLTVLATFCLGLCACGPAALLDGQPLARLDHEALAGAVQQACSA